MANRKANSIKAIGFIAALLGVLAYSQGAFAREQTARDDRFDRWQEEMCGCRQESRPPSLDYYYNHDRRAPHGLVLG